MFMESFTVDKALNNNVIIARHPSLGEVVLIGKGIGFGKKSGDLLDQDVFEKMFVLKNKTFYQPNKPRNFLATLLSLVSFYFSGYS